MDIVANATTKAVENLFENLNIKKAGLYAVRLVVFYFQGILGVKKHLKNQEKSRSLSFFQVCLCLHCLTYCKYFQW